MYYDDQARGDASALSSVLERQFGSDESGDWEKATILCAVR